MKDSSALDVRYQFSRNMGVTNRRWIGLLDRRLRRLRITGSRLHALVELSKTADKPSQRELAARLGIEAATLVRLLDGLAKEGLVIRQAHDTDRRTNQLEITAKGQKVLAEVSSISTELRNELLDGIDDADLVVCQSVFTRIQAKLQDTTGLRPMASDFTPNAIEADAGASSAKAWKKA